MPVRLPEQLREVLTPEQRRDPDIQGFLRRALIRQLAVTLPSTAPTAALLTFLLWPYVPTTVLVVWLATVTANVALFIAYLRVAGDDPSHPRWESGMVACQALGAVQWVILLWFGMPLDPTGQALMGTIVMAVGAASLVFTAPVRAAFVGFFVPFLGVAAPAFLLSGTELGTLFGSMLAFGTGFSVVLNRLSRAGFEHAALLAVGNARLVGELEVERAHIERVNDELERQVRRDPLTGLANRAGLNEALDHAIAAGEGCAVIFVDIDRFKRINDRHGHEIGDAVLRTCAERFRARIPPPAVLARAGGDELVVVLPGVIDPGVAEAVAVAMRNSLRTPVTQGSTSVRVRTSMGIAVVDPADHTTTVEHGSQLLRRADAALYRAKASGRDRIDHDDADLRADDRRRSDEVADLRAALDGGRITAWYQPIVELATGRVVAAEALARWQHPDGVRSAESFWASATQGGLVAPITWRVLDEVLDVRTVHSRAMVPVSVNVPIRHLPDLCSRLDDRTGDLSGLTIEVGDHRPDDDLAAAITAIESIRRRGGRIVIDDLGSGNAALGLLTDLPADGLKIDRELVARLERSAATAAIVRGTVHLARDLGLDVIAEGIETERQRRLLLDLGARRGQGFLFDHALPPDRFLARLHAAPATRTG